ncbi:hypothetical protein V7S43_017476 [Phytophthora oleae]|uniref:Uncharacterized protein n=1 Tax=Phytophthora oleae TaxID=2107226 RepID=A0ABD3EU25_9STRA
MGNVSGCCKDSDKNIVKTTSATVTETGNDRDANCKGHDVQTPPVFADESQSNERSTTKSNKSPKASSSYTSTVSSDAPTHRNHRIYGYHNSGYTYNSRPGIGAPGIGAPGIGGGGGFGGGFGGGGACGGGGCCR